LVERGNGGKAKKTAISMHRITLAAGLKNASAKATR